MTTYRRDHKGDYQRNRERLLSDERIHPKTRDLWRRFLDWEEYKLKRVNSLEELDRSSYLTLHAYTQRLTNVGVWFGKVALEDATREDIKRVYDALEDGKIKNRKGERFKDRTSYYNKIFKSKPFEMAGKAALAREVIEFQQPQHDGEVRFIVEEEFRKIVEHTKQTQHKFLLWLLFDIGENVNSILELRSRDFERRLVENAGFEYRVHLRRSTLKRTRQTRSEITNFPETARYADEVLEGLTPDERIFKFGYRNVVKIFQSAVRVSGAVAAPNDDKPKLKDLRSGMACHLLRSGWTTDEVKARLGHSPSSKMIDRYVTYLAISRDGAKRKLENASIQELRAQIQQFEQREKLARKQNEERQQEQSRMMEEIQKLKELISMTSDDLTEKVLQKIARDKV